ncbi:shikimate dehydrogenase [Oricola cellulosilytica]|uniref:Shikimate dehydrogenase (NADP(+)) n=1 Tax=Oricola cellulosilytica TaxID=1429082 RepID=A0A4R0PK18_9HYPH|nr:shikimate dehydrogenase [Oricola cellulosilytica]TCD15989.1 shikimate dehydrogenase [Oricola cellulosilytica]
MASVPHIPRAFVAGHPIGHSRSPFIHSTWLDRYAIEGTYQSLDVKGGDFPGLLDSVRRGEWLGGNVTIPHKEAAFRLCARRDEDAEAIGAVNTIWLENGRLVGGNTDAYGFSANLDQHLRGWRDGQRALVLGAGGASRAVLHALLSAGYSRVDVANRTPERAETLEQSFGPRVRAHGWDKADSLVAGADLIVNTTSLGMEGNPPLQLELEGSHVGAMATDIVYAPLETPFLAACIEAGMTTCDGLGMLLHQAVPGFARWFGTKPEVDAALRNAVIADLNRPGP